MPKLKGALEWNSRESRTVYGMYGLHPPLRPDEKTPLDIYEARSAARIASQAEEGHDAADALPGALQLLQSREHDGDFSQPVWSARLE